MGQLTASIAHEMNQPIAATVINAHAALRWLSAQRPDSEEVRQSLTRIVENGSRAGEVIRRIRALIRNAPPRKDWVAINGAILEVVDLTHGEATKNGVTVRTQLAKGLPPIEGDRVQLQQVILNLVINAIEAMSGSDERRGNWCSAPEETSRMMYWSQCGIRARDWRRRPRSAFSTPFLQPSRAAWGWGCRSAAR